jgi:hypothetical protein
VLNKHPEIDAFFEFREHVRELGLLPSVSKESVGVNDLSLPAGLVHTTSLLGPAAADAANV